MNYSSRFIDVIEYIDANLDDKLDVDVLCRQASLSKYHFHRQCSAYFGVSIMQVVKLLRLKRAAYQLAYRADEMKIIDIALTAGYDSHEAFSRAFKRVFEQSPTAFKHAPNWTYWHTNYDLIRQLRTNNVNPSKHYEVTIQAFPETQLAVLEHKGSPALLGKSIQQFITWRKANRLPPNKHRTFNLLYNDPNITPPDEYRFGLGCEIQSGVEDNEYQIRNDNIPEGLCAVIRHQGSDDALGPAIHYLFVQWLDSSEYSLREFPIFLERVSFFPEVAEHEAITDIFLPIELR